MRTKARIQARWVLWVVLAAAVAALVVVAVRPQPTAADFAVVKRGPLRVTLDEEGETRVRERYVVSAPLAGRVLRIELDPGDAVTADQTVLAAFEPGDPTLLDVRSRAEGEGRVRAARAALGEAEARREQARAELEFAKSEVGRYRKLADQGIVSTERYDVAELEVDTRSEALEASEFGVRNAGHELEVARARLLEAGANGAEPGAGSASRASATKSAADGTGVAGVMTLRSPVDGVVLRVLRESEAVVPAGEALLEVADPADLEIVADFLSTDAVRMRPGNRVLVEQWGGDTPLAGRVRRIEPSGFTKISALGVEEQRVNVIVDLADTRQAWSSLGDGFRVEVRVVVWEKDEVLKLPTSSLFRHGEIGDSWAVFVVEDGRAALRTVVVGERNELEAEVLEGLAEGVSVVVHPSDEVVDGGAVKAR